ncbi:hypothetical protein SMSP2_02081 [Limihaloglobus sulfuriphilus]|uniref:Uncharacterized protein n=1 Tax=Limihaloglobus sulfuriphilus TaxID=1851148 RepID=A0A1Q2MGC5_9BACT|nr:hypothetical protein [Limihaloglobus sulfuriphilus]AQQ71704.1 hypothetical protein SMSP2_02081 [Limihaloglobus sulfuriphilus]
METSDTIRILKALADGVDTMTGEILLHAEACTLTGWKGRPAWDYECIAWYY